MAKAVEITFAIGAALTGGFTGAFGKAGQALGELQKQISSLQQVSSQIESYQKMQGAIASTEAEVASMRQQAQSLDTQITASKATTSELNSQYRTAQQEVDRLNSAYVRNRDALTAAQLNVKSLENQIRSSKQPTAELQAQYTKAQEEVRRLGGAVKRSSTELKAAQSTAQKLKTEMRDSATQTRTLSREARELTVNADNLEDKLSREREALSQLRTELTEAGIDTNNLASEQARLTQQAQRAADAQTKLQNSKAALEATKSKLSFSNIKGDLMTAAGLGYSLYKPTMIAADFEQAMARTKAVAFTGKNKSAEQKAADDEAFAKLQAQARQLGRDTQYTATQAANSQEMLARAGFNSDEIISAMPGLLSMAAAEGMDLANAADIAASTLRGFNMSADQAGRVADVLAQMSSASNSSIAGLGESMKYVAPVASGLGVSVEETAAMLGVMANAGIKGTQAGNALKGAFSRLSKEPKAVEKALANLGVATRDAQGRLRKMPGLMQELASKMKDMGEADQMKNLVNIFGEVAAPGMLAVMRGAVDGTLKEYEQLGKESTGVLGAMADAVGVSMEDMRAGMKNAEPAASSLGVSFRDLSIYLAALAKNGIKGADADKALTAAFTRMAKEPKQVQKALDTLKISAFDDAGNMRSVPDLMNDINKAIGGMSEADQLNALTGIFGKDAATGMLAVVRSMVDGTIDEYNKLADKTTGISKDMADVMLDTLQGQMTVAGSAIESLMIDIGSVLLPASKEMVKTFSNWTAGLSGLAQSYPRVTKAIVGGIAAISAYKVGVTGMKIAWNITKLPFQHARVAMDWLNAKLVASGKSSLLAAAKTKVLTAAQKSWQVVMKAGRGLLNVGKIILYGAKSAVVAVAKGTWTAAEWLWVAAMRAGRGLLDVGKLVLYGAKTIVVSIATKAWSITQGLLNFALRPFSGLLNIGKLALYYIKTIAVSVATKAWAITQKLLNFAMKPFQGLLNVGRLVLYYAKTIAISVATKAWTAAQWLWNAAMNANPIGLLVIAIAGLVAAGYYLYKNWDSVSAWWGKTWENISSKASSAVEFVKAIMSSIGGWATKYFKMDFSGMFKGLKSALGSLWDTLSNLGNAFKSLLKLDLSGVWDSLVASAESIKGIFRGIGEALMSLFNIDTVKVIEGVKNIVNGITGIFTGIGETIKGLFTFDFSGLKDGLLSALNSALDTLAGIGKTIAGLFNIDCSGMWDTLKSGWDSAMDAISSGIGKFVEMFDFSGVWDKFGAGFDSICGSISEKFSSFTSWIGSGLSSAWDWTASLFGYGGDTPEAQKEQLQAQVKDVTVLNKMSEGFSERVAEMSATWQPFKDSLGEGFEQFYTVMQGVADNIRTVVIPAVNELSSSLGKIATEIASVAQAGNIKVEVPQSKSSSWFSWGSAHAEGGIFSKPHIGLVAEAGREAIIPLENPSRGVALWLEAGRELGLVPQGNVSNANVPELKVPDAGMTSSEYNTMSMLNNLSAGNTDQSSNAISSVVNALKFQQSAGDTFFTTLTRSLAGSSAVSNQTTNNNYSGMSIPEIMRPSLNLTPPELGSINMLTDLGIQGGANLFSQINAGLGDSPSLEDTTGGIPLWLAAGQEMGTSFGSPITNNNRPVTMSSNFNITVNGGEPGIEQKFRQIIEEVLSDMQDREERTTFE